MATDHPDSPVMYVPEMAVFLNRWYSSYAEARTALETAEGFLLPYRGHFVVVEAEAVRELGLEPADPDWERIGRDWVRPRDAAAWERLRLRRDIAL